jgi:hypothetical protein
MHRKRWTLDSDWVHGGRVFGRFAGLLAPLSYLLLVELLPYNCCCLLLSFTDIACYHPQEMGALSKLIFGGEQYCGKVEGEWQDITAEPATLEVGMTEADLSNKGLQAGGAIIVAAWISHKDKGALSRFDISENNIKAEGARHLAEALKGNQVMTES